jgi:uncharacterized damage-inducible protein DinB
MSFIENLIHEFQHESAITRRVLERVPADNLTWKPHAKSMSIGELALHIPHELKILAPTVLAGGYDFGTHVGVRQPASADEVLTTLNEAENVVASTLRQLGDEGLQRTWNATFKGAPYFSIPAAAFVRTVLLNHTYHHRGQLSVYLRLLDIPVPAIYGPSADEASFAVNTTASA